MPSSMPKRDMMGAVRPMMANATSHAMAAPIAGVVEGTPAGLTSHVAVHGAGATLDQPPHEQDDADDDEEMDEAGNDVEAEPEDGPEDDEDDAKSDECAHDDLLKY